MNGKQIIDIKNLVKVYKGSDQPAVNDVSLQIEENEIFGLLGPNGAGKTTTISILCGFLRPTSGKVIIDGLNLNSDLLQIKKIVGVVPQEIALYPTLTARENLWFFGSMYGIKGRALKDRIDECLEIFGLDGDLRKKVHSFSGGMKRRVNLIAGLLHKPKILFLDEPTVGIDVQSRNQIVDYLREINKQGITIIYTSHYMEEAERLCKRIAIIDYGKILTQGYPSQMIDPKKGYNNLESIFLHLTGRELRD
jgi:ABC-2 type transport system ATP-binding protein